MKKSFRSWGSRFLTICCREKRTREELRELFEDLFAAIDAENSARYHETRYLHGPGTKACFASALSVIGEGRTQSFRILQESVAAKMAPECQREPVVGHPAYNQQRVPSQGNVVSCRADIQIPWQQTERSGKDGECRCQCKKRNQEPARGETQGRRIRECFARCLGPWRIHGVCSLKRAC